MANKSADEAERPAGERGPGVALVGTLLLASIMVMIDSSATVVALPSIRDEFDVGKGALVWVQVAASLAGVAIAIPIGAIGDRYGQGKFIAAGITLFAAGALLSTFSVGRTDAAPTLLILGRFLAGAGGTAITVLSLALVTSSVARARIPWVVGLWTAVTSGGAALAPLVSGLIVETLGWRWVYALPLIPLAAAALVLLVVRPGFGSTASTQVSWLAGAVLATGLLLLTAAFTALEDGTSDLHKSVFMFVLGLALLAGFAVAQNRSANPLVAWSDLRAPGVLAALAGRATVALLFGAAMFEFSLLLLNAFGYRPTQVGALSISPTVASICMSTLSSRISARIGVAWTAALGCSALATGIALLSTFDPGTHTVAIGAALTVVGTGNGLLTATLSATVLAGLPRRSQGQGSGVFTIATLVPSVLGLSLVGITTAAVIRGLWTSQVTGRCQADAEVLSDIGSGAIADIAQHCGDALGATARAIYVDGVTSVLRAIAVVLGVVAVGALWGLRHATAPRPAASDG